MIDAITENLCEELKRRAELGAELGVKKYGVTVLDRTDLTRRQWLQHCKEEMLDSIVYIEKLLQDESF